jgi:hypothetical protein
MADQSYELLLIYWNEVDNYSLNLIIYIKITSQIHKLIDAQGRGRGEE